MLPAILFYRCHLDLLSFFRHLISEVAWLIVTNLSTCLMVTQIYKIRSEIWVASPLPPKCSDPKTSKFWHDFAQLRDVIAIISVTQQDIVNRQNGVTKYGHYRTGKLNSVYFGAQTAKNRTGVLTHPTGGHQAGHCHASSFILCTFYTVMSVHFIRFSLSLLCLFVSKINALIHSCSIPFLRATAYAKRAYAIAIPSVCLSVTRVDQSKTVEVRIIQFSPHSSPIPLVFVR